MQKWKTATATLLKMQRSQLNQVHLGEVGWTATEDRPALAIQRLVLVADPDMLAESLCSVDFVVADPEIITRDPNDGALSAKGLVLECTLHQLVALVGGEILQFIVNTCKERMPHCLRRWPLVLGIVSHLLSQSLDGRAGVGRIDTEIFGPSVGGAIDPRWSSGTKLGRGQSITRIMAQPTLSVRLQALEFNVASISFVMALLARVLSETSLNVVILVIIIDGESKPGMLGTSKLRVATNSCVFQGDWQIPDQRTERIVQEDLVSDGQDENDNHADALTFTDHVAILIPHQEEQTDQTHFHEVQPSEELIDSPRE